MKVKIQKKKEFVFNIKAEIQWWTSIKGARPIAEILTVLFVGSEF